MVDQEKNVNMSDDMADDGSEEDDEYLYSDSDDLAEESCHHGKQLAEADAEAFEPSDGIAAKVDAPSPIFLRLWVSILPWRLYEGLGARTVEALGLDPTKGVQVMLTADQHYTKSSARPRVKWVRQVAPDAANGNMPTENSEGASFPLEWMLRKRLEEELFRNWPPKTQGLDLSLNLDDIWADLVDNDDSGDGGVASSTNRVAEALLFDKPGAIDFDERLASKQRPSAGGVAGTDFDGASLAARRSIDAISECTGASKELAQFALREAKCDQQAQLNLLEEKSRAYLEVALKKDRAASIAELGIIFPGVDQSIIQEAVLTNAGSLKRQSAQVQRVQADEFLNPLLLPLQQQQQPGAQETNGVCCRGGGDELLSERQLRWQHNSSHSDPSAKVLARASWGSGGQSLSPMSPLSPLSLTAPISMMTDELASSLGPIGGLSGAEAGAWFTEGLGSGGLESHSMSMESAEDDKRAIRRLRLEFLAESNFLLRVALLLIDKIRNATKHCLVCDDPIEGYLPAVPIVCSKDLCIMSSEDMGCGTDVESQVEKKGDTVDLLLGVFVMAMKGNRPEISFPKTIQWDGRLAFQSTDEDDGITKKIDVSQLLHVLSLIPSVTDMQRCIQRKRNNVVERAAQAPPTAPRAWTQTEAQAQMAQAQIAQAQMAQAQTAQAQMAQAQMAQAQITQTQMAQAQMAQTQMVQAQMAQALAPEAASGVGGGAAIENALMDDPNVRVQSLREALADRHPLAYVLLRWLLSANRAHLRPLSEGEVIQEIPCEKQFLLVTGTAERESKFQMMKRQAAAADPAGGSGSFFAFHGSKAENWHGILREGLKNMSGTKYMSAGAAHGKGIYMADALSVALGYASSSSSANHWINAGIGGTAVIVAVCEVVDRNRAEWSRGNRYFVVPDEECVATRFLLINPQNGERGRGNVFASQITSRLESSLG